MCDDICAPKTDLPPILISDATRRNFMKGLVSLPLATVLSVPGLASVQASRTTDVTMQAENGATVRGALALPESTEPAPAVLLIHEWWGLNDQIKAVAADFAARGYVAFAIDLYGGEVATDRDGARRLIQAVDEDKATAELIGAADWLKAHDRTTGKLGTIGWCFGGGWSLRASIAAPVDATVIYYGRVTRPADELAKLAGPVMGHFGTLDRGISKEMVTGFENEMATAGKSDSLTVHWYEADHAFANPTGSRYDQDDASLALERTLAFYKKHLG